MAVLRGRAARSIARSTCCGTSASATCGSGRRRPNCPAAKLQRIKLATELQRSAKGDTLYVLDEPTTGLHPADVERLVVQLERLVEAGNTVVVVEHDMRVVAAQRLGHRHGPGAGDEGGSIVVTGLPAHIAKSKRSRTAPYLAEFIGPRAANERT